MADAPQISEAEWRVMQVLWAEAPLSAAEVVQRLRRSRWHARTIKTMLGRLVRKGALSYQVEGNRYLYRPAVSRQTCIRQASRSFIRGVFDGQAAPMLVHLIRQARLSPEQIQQLKQILDDKER